MDVMQMAVVSRMMPPTTHSELDLIGSVMILGIASILFVILKARG